MIKITFKIGKDEKVLDALKGETLLELANRSDVNLFGGCSGAGVCGTCHVFISPEYINKVKEANSEELDLLDILPNGKTNSRLACQIIISEELDGMIVEIPQ